MPESMTPEQAADFMPDAQDISESPKIRSFKSKEFLRILAGSDKFQPLRDKLEHKHPEYDANIRIWRKYGDVALNRIRTEEEKKMYLIKGINESDQQFTIRAQLSAFAPETPELLNDFIGAVFTIPATRDIKLGNGDQAIRITQFMNSAGRNQVPVEMLSQKALRLALTFNLVDGFLDHPADAETEVPYVVLYTPEDRYDWEYNDLGQYVWVKYHSSYSRQSTWDAKSERVDEYRIIDSGAIALYRIVQPDGKPEYIEGPFVAPHKFPRAPVCQLAWNPEAHAFVKSLVDLDIKTFRLESDHTYDVHNTAHPTLLSKLRPDAEGNERTFESIARGSDKCIHLMTGDPEHEGEDVSYLESSTTDLQHQSEQAIQTREQCRRLAGTGGSQMEQSPSLERPESGVALSYKQAQREKNYRQAAIALAEWEWQLIELVLAEGSGPDEINREDVIHLQYPNSFDMRTQSELQENLAAAVDTGSDTLVKTVKKSLASKLLGSSVTHEMRTEIMKEIESADVLPQSLQPEIPEGPPNKSD